MADEYLGENLIFIISQPRSGSTLLQRMLSGNKDIKASAETWLMLHPLYAVRSEGIVTDYGARWAALALNEFLEHYTDGASVHDSAVRSWARVFYENALENGNGRIFVDKTPRYAMILPELLRLFPKARFIFLLRNPMAVLYSELNSFVKDDFNMLFEFRTDLLDTPRQILNGIKQLGDAAIIVRYEALVANPELEMKRLCSGLGVEYCEAMIDYGATPAAKGFMTDRVGIGKRTRPVADSIDKWRGIANDPQQQHFAQQYLMELDSDVLAGLGYDHDDMLAVVGSGKVDPPGLYPWRLAINRYADFSMRDRFTHRCYRRRKEKGAVLGSIAATYDLIRETGRILAKECSRIPR
ncbi:MAG: sulfotransferase [Gammaproteobacteria bacterium]|nr:sulfotransferase [Gammaproteobacteria bacterium]